MTQLPKDVVRRPAPRSIPAGGPDHHQRRLADLSAFVLGGLSERQSARVCDHLASCSRCTSDLPALREAAALLGEVPPEMFWEGPPERGDLLVRRAVRAIREPGSATGRGWCRSVDQLRTR
jgi:anti-sigma factor RsiW